MILSKLQHVAIGASLLVLPSTALAQGRHVFEVDSAASVVTFSGTVTAVGITGQIVGNPNTITFSGSLAADTTVSGGQVVSAQVLSVPGAEVSLSPINATVPNPIPIFPPLATITATNIVVRFRSTDAMGVDAPFAVDPVTGAFTSFFVAEALSGTVNVTGVIAQTIDLTNSVSDPLALSGTVDEQPDGLRFTLPINGTFPFNIPPIDASLTLNGGAQADDIPFAADKNAQLATTGGTQNLRLSAGTANAGETYLVLSSAAGTAPGLPLPGGLTLPLNPDSIFDLSFTSANMGLWGNTFGTLDGAGIADATFFLPPLPDILAMIGLTFDHAYLVVDPSGNILAVSNPVTLALI
jgi:hypothetical protein